MCVTQSDRLGRMTDKQKNRRTNFGSRKQSNERMDKKRRCSFIVLPIILNLTFYIKWFSWKMGDAQ